MYQTFTLPNGIKLLHRQISNGVAHLGLYVNAGSRDERADENGIAHFIEHMIFKGTRKRKAFHILSRMENVGGDLNAYTTKEETCIYCSFMPSYYDRALQLIQDITFNSVFPEKEIKKEKDVIVDEINSYRDNPSEEIYDEFENLLFDGHPIGRNILGTPDTVKHIKRNQLQHFVSENYSTSKIVIASVGNISFTRLKNLVLKYYSEISSSPSSQKRERFTNYQPASNSIGKPTYLSHGCIGNLAYPMDDKRRLTMVLLNNILGGPGMNSRLNLSVREKYGFTYTIDSMYQSYSDSGVFCIYLGTMPGYMERSVELVHKEMDKLRKVKMGTLQIKRARQQLIGQLAISLESHLSEMLSKGKSLLHLNRVFTFEEICSGIEKITPEELMETANEVFDPVRLSSLLFKSNQKEDDD